MQAPTHFIDVKESYNDVRKCQEFFRNKDGQDFDQVYTLTDESNCKLFNVSHEKIWKQFDIMMENCPKVGKNLFTFNVISFHGHGFNFDGDPIAVFSEETQDG